MLTFTLAFAHGVSAQGFADDFAGTGELQGYTTNNGSALPDVTRFEGRYRARLTNNSNNITLHFNDSQGRLDAKRLAFPFDVIARNIGIGIPENSQIAPSPAGNPFIFAGIQVHVLNLNQASSSHVVVGHRGSTHFTIEGKNTLNGDSSVNDDGANVLPMGRADIRIQGNADRSLTIYWQNPNPNPGVMNDDWNLYRGTGQLPGPSPSYESEVYVGLITYAFFSTGVPFTGTADALEVFGNTPNPNIFADSFE